MTRTEDDPKDLCSGCAGSGEVVFPGDTIDAESTFGACPSCRGSGLKGVRGSFRNPAHRPHGEAIDAAVKAIEDAFKARGERPPRMGVVDVNNPRYPKGKGNA